MASNLFTLAILVVVVLIIGLGALVLVKGTGFARPLAEPTTTLPPVLLDTDPSAADVDALRFSVGLRGYRTDQVDEVLDALSSPLRTKDAEIQRLKSEAVRQSDSEN